MPDYNVVRRIGPWFVAAFTAAMAAWTWRSWPDPVVDFGQQLYVSWRMAEGALLYRDLAYHYGPLSPWLNALAFEWFGVGLMTIVILNLVILAGVLVLLYRILGAIGGPLGATIACLIFSAVFGFAQLVEFGNYNFVTPYVHGVTHGIALSLLAIWLLGLYHRRPGRAVLSILGLVIGLLFLTKAELFLAGGLAIFFGLALTWRLRPPASRILDPTILLGSALVPPAISLALLASRMPLQEAWNGTVGTWPAIFAGEVGRLRLYRWSFGLEYPEHSMRMMLKSVAWYALLLGPPALWGLSLRRTGRARPLMAVAVFVAVAAFLWWWPVWWPGTVGLLPPAMLLLIGVKLWSFRGKQALDEESSRGILMLTTALFALVLMGRVLLYVRTYHYGFALAMPATMLAVVAIYAWLPEAIERRGGYGGLARAAALAVLAAFAAGHLGITAEFLDDKHSTVASGRDSFRADSRGAAVAEILVLIEEQVPPKATLAVLPTGVMLNYLSRRANPTRFLYFMPSDVMLYEEQTLLAGFEATPPDFVVLVHKDTSEFGARFFGVDYGQALHEWIRNHYRPVGTVGAPPLRDERFGMMLLKRAPPLPGGLSYGSGANSRN